MTGPWDMIHVVHLVTALSCVCVTRPDRQKRLQRSRVRWALESCKLNRESAAKRRTLLTVTRMQEAT